MKPDGHEPRDDARDREALIEQHRDASRTLDERPSDSVRTRVMAAAEAGQALHRARASRRARSSWRKLVEPRAAIALVMVAVLTGLVASRTWDRADLGEAKRAESVATASLPRSRESQPTEMRIAPSAAPGQPVRPVTPMIASADTHAAAERERNAERRSFSRDRSEPLAARKGDVPKVAPAVVDKPAEPTEPPAASPPVLAASPAASETAFASRSDVAVAAQTPSSAAPPSTTSAFSANAETSRAPAPAPVSQAAKARAASDAPSPDAWLARIVRLRRAGDDVAADAELARFRQSHPDLPVPGEASRATPR